MERAVHSLSFANRQLEKADREKNEFLGMVAHDLKNPLSIVMGFAEMIAEAGSGIRGAQPQGRRPILEAAQRMIALITQLLDVNTIEHGHFPINLTPCELKRREPGSRRQLRGGREEEGHHRPHRRKRPRKSWPT